MQLAEVLDACEQMEARAAALYRRFASEAPAASPYAALWAEMAGEEEQHAASVRDAHRDLPSVHGWHIRLDGWNEALQAIDERLRRGEALPPTASDDERAGAALDIEMGELDALRQAAIGEVGVRRPDEAVDHLSRLADIAVAHSTDPHVRTLVGIARARRRLASRR